MPPQRLFERLPTIWKRWDRDSGFCEDFLDVLDDSCAKAHGSIKDILDLRSIDRIPDRYLALVADHVGHVWRSDKTRDWNRARIRDAVRRHSYKGTHERLADLVKEHGGGSDWSVKDMASTLFVWNRQGLWSRGDSFLLSSDYFHPGAFRLCITDAVDLDAFLEDFEETKPAGQVWYFEIAKDASGLCETVGESFFDVEEDAVPPRQGRWNLDLFWNREPSLAVEFVLRVSAGLGLRGPAHEAVGPQPVLEPAAGSGDRAGGGGHTGVGLRGGSAAALERRDCFGTTSSAPRSGGRSNVITRLQLQAGP